MEENGEPSLPDGILIEGIVTTTNSNGSTNVSPMGPILNPSFARLLLRPFPTSTTFGNLKRHGEGVFHVTDDVELLAQAAVGQPEPFPRLIPATVITGKILADACRWYAFRVEEFDDRHERPRIVARVVGRGRIRDFVGFNRAKHAVVEAAILATRLNILPIDEILAEVARLALPVQKTGGHAERNAFQFLCDYIHQRVAPVGESSEVGHRRR